MRCAPRIREITRMRRQVQAVPARRLVHLRRSAARICGVSHLLGSSSSHSPSTSMSRSSSSYASCLVRQSPVRRYSETRASLQTSGGSNGSSDGIFVRIPDPTWSLEDLELTKSQEPVALVELKDLARKSLLRIDENGTDSRSDNDLCSSLQQDLGNMLHMVEQVHSYSLSQKEATDDHGNNDIDGDGRELSATQKQRQDSEIYDRVRGVTKAPVRRSDSAGDTSASSHTESQSGVVDDMEAHAIWESMLKPKTKRVGGGHHYFSVITKD